MSVRFPPMTAAAAALAGQFKRPRLDSEVIVAATIVLDAISITLAVWFALFAQLSIVDQGGAGFGMASVFSGIGGTGCVALSGAYRIKRLGRTAPQLKRLAWAATLPAASVVLMVFGDAAGGNVALGVGLATFAVLALLRCTVTVPATAWAIDSGLTERRAVLLGGGDPARDLISGLAQNPDSDIRICAIFDDRSDDRSPELVLNVPKIGRFDDLLVFARKAEIDLVIIALPLEASARIAGLLAQFKVLPLPVHLAQYSKDYVFDRSVPGPGQARLRLLAQESFGLHRRVVKKVFDVVLSLAVLVLLSPFLALIALAIRWDSPGPVLFRQTRSGFNERDVDVYKFRTMYQGRCDSRARAIVLKEDPRVTRVGAFLRKTSLDELPQLINVLRGELSLVGPRPHAVEAVTARQEAFADLVAGYSARHRLPPGITGWAQIHGWRGGIEDPKALEARVSHDLWYIENWSLWLDLRILLSTPLALFDTRNAY